MGVFYELYPKVMIKLVAHSHKCILPQRHETCLSVLVLYFSKLIPGLMCELVIFGSTFFRCACFFSPLPETLFCALLSRVSKLLRSSEEQRHILSVFNRIYEH